MLQEIKVFTLPPFLFVYTATTDRTPSWNQRVNVNRIQWWVQPELPLCIFSMSMVELAHTDFLVYLDMLYIKATVQSWPRRVCQYSQLLGP